jgi:hypothetical protein
MIFILENETFLFTRKKYDFGKELFKTVGLVAKAILILFMQRCLNRHFNNPITTCSIDEFKI